jgi:hypothetical protein
LIFSPSFPGEAHSGGSESQSFSATFDGLFSAQQLHPPPVAERQAHEGERPVTQTKRPGDASAFHPRDHPSRKKLS